MPFAFPHRTIKRLRVVVTEDGVIEPFHPNLHNDEEWWRDVLADPRARTTVKKPGSWRPLAPRLRGHTLVVTFDKCPKRIERDGDELAAINLPDVPVALIASLLAECRTRPKWCRVRYALQPKTKG